MPDAELERLWHRLQPLAVPKMPLSEPPPRGSRFGSPLVLSRVHWVRPEMVAEVSYAEWTPDGLLRHVVYLGEREDNRPSTCTADGLTSCKTGSFLTLVRTRKSPVASR
jgi:ATP-dependent DNA ligase